MQVSLSDLIIMLAYSGLAALLACQLQLSGSGGVCSARKIPLACSQGFVVPLFLLLLGFQRIDTVRESLLNNCACRVHLGLWHKRSSTDERRAATTK